MIDMYEVWLQVQMPSGARKMFQLQSKPGNPMFTTIGSAIRALKASLDVAHKGFVLKRECVREMEGRLRPGQIPAQLKNDLENMPDIAELFPEDASDQAAGGEAVDLP